MAMDLYWWDEKFDLVTSFSKEAKRGFTCVEVNGLLAKKTVKIIQTAKQGALLGQFHTKLREGLMRS